MSSDLQALLAAIVANPSDDVARLVYADCLEEHGNAPRAQFIRLQIEAERHHPDSNARAELEAKAESLFEQHWIEWWGEVCAAVVLPPPAPKPRGLLARLAGRVGFRQTGGVPYHNAGVSVRKLTWDDSGMGNWDVTFRRGFPDTVDRGASRQLSAWHRVSPLHALRTDSSWVPGPHLRGIRSLHLTGPAAAGVLDVLTAPDSPALEELTLTPQFGDPSEADAFADTLLTLLSSPAAVRLKSFHVQAQSVEGIMVLARSPRLASLSALGVDLTGRLGPWGPAEDRLAMLARSPYLSGLRELTVVGVAGGSLAEQARATGTKWTGLRKLILGLGDGAPCDSLDAVELSMTLEVLLSGEYFPALEELRITGGIVLDRQVIDALVCSPLLKRLRHFALTVFDWGVGTPDDLRRLPQMFDSDQIETFALRCPRRFPAEGELRKRLGDRLRVIKRR